MTMLKQEIRNERKIARQNDLSILRKAHVYNLRCCCHPFRFQRKAKKGIVSKCEIFLLDSVRSGNIRYIQASW